MAIPKNAFRTREEAEKILEEIRGERFAIVEEVKKSLKKTPPPPLYNLNALQKDANKLFGFSAQKTLNIAQSLYEKHKIISYPRTESRYLATSNKKLVEEILRLLGREDLIPKIQRVGKRVFDDSKLTDHHAIIPLKPPPQNLTSDERKVYELIQRRFFAVFMDEYISEIVRAILRVKRYRFLAQGKRDISLGWKELYREEEKELPLPPLKKGDRVEIENLFIEEKKTEPPPRYTEGSLIALMEKLGLGTPATRASIIETLKQRGYIFTSKKNLLPTEKAFELMKHLGSLEIADVSLTSKWEKGLENIHLRKVGKKGYEFFMEKIRDFVQNQIETLKNVELEAPPVALQRGKGAKKTKGKKGRGKKAKGKRNGVKS